MGYRSPPKLNHGRPDSAEDISRHVEELIREADVAGQLPTPFASVLEVARVKEKKYTQQKIEEFLSGREVARQTATREALSKVRGFAVLTKREIYVAPHMSGEDARAARWHEAGHVVLPWHRVAPRHEPRGQIYIDFSQQLSPVVQDLFEVEANLFAEEMTFQGERFGPRAKDVHVAFESVFGLAQQHGASVEDTLRRFVRYSDNSVGGLIYIQEKGAAKTGSLTLARTQLLGSRRFLEKFGSISFPFELGPNDPWYEAFVQKQIVEGDLPVSHDGGRSTLRWGAWGSGEALYVLVWPSPGKSVHQRA